MTEPARKLTYTFAEHLALEEKSETRHEYVNGEIVARADSTLEHCRLAVNIAVELRRALWGRPFMVLGSDMRAGPGYGPRRIPRRQRVSRPGRA